MSVSLQVIFTAAATLIGGVLLLLFGEFMKILVIIPLKSYKDHVQLILDRLDYHANFITNYFSENPSDEELAHKRSIIKDFRSAATKLSSTYAGISLRRWLVKVKLLPDLDVIEEIHKNLIFISNNMPTTGRVGNNETDPIMRNHEASEKIKRLLF
jgi:hypothetical protein